MSRKLEPVVSFKGTSGFLTGNSARVQKALRKGILCYNRNNFVINEANLFLEKYWYSRGLNFVKNGREITPSLSPPRKVDIAEEGVTEKSKKRGPAPFEWAPFPRIPNVAQFKIKDNGYDELMRMFNLDKKLPRSFETEPYNNGSKVKYAKRQILYLRKLVGLGRYETFWKTSYFLLGHSTVFQMMGVYKCFPGFHRDLSLKTVYAILDEVRRVVREKSWNLKYKRVYIPKGLTDKWRPLGVPTPVWRVILAALTFFIVTAYDHLLPPWQHAYRPGKGTLSAWEVVLSKVRHSKYIWEFDIKGFFDNVPVKDVLSGLGDKMPTWLQEAIIQMTEVAIKLPVERKIDEKAADAKVSFQQDKAVGTTYTEVESSLEWEDDEFMDDVDAKEAAFFKSIGREVPRYDGPLESFESPKSDKYKYPSVGDIDEVHELRYKGFPQGVAYSAFLSVLHLRSLNLPGLLMYADDGLVYSDAPINVNKVKNEFGWLGLKLSEPKCKWIKQDGKWVSRLKFLGLVLEDGERLKSETRSDWRRGGTEFREGVSHEFNQHELVRAKTLQGMGVPTHLAFKLATVSGKISQFYGEVRYLPVRLLRSGKLLVQGWDWTQRKFSMDLYRRYIPKHWLGTKEEIHKYFWLLLTGRIMTVSEDNAESIRPVYEESLMALAKLGESKESLQGRLDYLIKLKPLNLSSKVESAIIRGVTWEEVLDSRLMGWFQSKMYSSGFINDKVLQDFTLTFKAGTSWTALRSEKVFKYERYYKGLKLDFANSTSIAWHDILEMYAVHAKCRIWLQAYKKGWISLEEMNNRRGAIARPPIKGTYVRHLIPVIPMDEFASGRLLTWSETRLFVDSKVQKTRGRPLGQTNPSGHLAGRPSGTKNKPGHRAGRPRKVN